MALTLFGQEGVFESHQLLIHQVSGQQKNVSLHILTGKLICNPPKNLNKTLVSFSTVQLYE